MDNEATGTRTPTPPPPAAGAAPPGPGGAEDRELLDWHDQVVQGFHAVQREVFGELAERSGLDRVRADVLVRLLLARDHRMPMTRLAGETDMSKGGFTKLADRLCSAGLARRVACEADRRVTYLELTAEGEDTAGTISRASAQILRRRVLAPLGRDGLAQIAEAMRTLRQAGGD